MAFNPAPFLRLSRTIRSSLIVGLFFSGAVLSQATLLLLHMSRGGPMQYNGHGAILGEFGFESLVGASFDLPEAVRIESIRAWVNGSRDGSVGIRPIDHDMEVPFYRSFSLEQVHDAPAKWQGVGSLNWDLKPGSYELLLRAPDIPYGYGSPGPWLPPLYNFYDISDYSLDFPGDAPPFGIQVYGSLLSAVPEPAAYGLVGVSFLALLSAGRAWKVKRRESAAMLSR